jgi:glyoxylase-like metal-dependent hydrolase (beta-lactamase superfamily II)
MNTATVTSGKKTAQDHSAHHTDDTNQPFFTVARGVWGLKDIFVNFYFIENSRTGDWILVDAGLVTSAPKIRLMAEALFGDKRPSAIILTHAHFDHRGSVRKLANEWQVPVYAHYLEMPYLTGESHYPPPDPTVGGGLMATMSPLYPDGPIDISGMVAALPENGIIPGMDEWRYIHTPGHAPGHISLFREEDRVVIAGDAVVTTVQESVKAVFTQEKVLCGPPKYFTYDWKAAKQSVKKILDLKPDVLATGHGKPMFGEEMLSSLKSLYAHFDEVAVPESGRYIDVPAYADEAGLHYVPPRERDTLRWVVLGVIGLAAIGTAAYIGYKAIQKRRNQPLYKKLIDRYIR